MFVRSVLFAALTGGASMATAATFTVSNLADGGAGSLRDAVAQANAAPGADTIVFQAGLVGTIALASGQITIADSVTIAGPGKSVVRIDAAGTSRVFHLDNPNGQPKTFAISGLSVSGGAINSGGQDSGGGLFYEDSGGDQITLSDMAFSANTAGRKGGAISVSGAGLRLVRVDLIDNHVRDGFQPSGGALYYDRGLVQLEHCRVIGNTAELNAGGIRLSSPGVSAVISDSLIQDNTATHTGGGILADRMNQLTIARSAFVGNVTGQPYGGGLYLAAVTDAGSPQNVIENTTFSDNRALHDSGRGSALALWSGNLTLRNSTIADNKTGPQTAPTANAGGAVWVGNGATTHLTVQSTLFAGNTHGNLGGRSDLTRLQGNPNGLLDTDHNAFETMPDAGTINGLNQANLFAIDAQLQPLTTSHGRGFVPLHPIARTSPVVDKGINPGNLLNDQRGPGFHRAFSWPNNPNGVPDIGAYELYGDTIFRNGFE